ncbi:MAG: Ku protein [Thermoleophilia bacterium]|nr:Ku protein [Thermoleophilia bacterium]
MPRALWTGTISFGLVNVPVRMYSATQEHDLHFHYVHEPDASRIGYEKICKAEGKPVPDDEIVKAFEWEEGEWVYMSDEDFAAAQVEGHRTIDITDFVAYDEIDPIFFEKTYYLGPQDGAERVYSLLERALKDSGLAGIATFVLRDRQHLGCLRVRDGVITLERMYFADEVRPSDDVKPADAKVDDRELEMATELIERFTSSWEPERYADTYRDTLCEIIKQKRKGKKVRVEQPAEAEEPADLMEALRASLEAAKKQRDAKPRKRAATRKNGSSRKRARSRSRG